MHFLIKKLNLLKYFTKNILRWFFIVLPMLYSEHAGLFAQAVQTVNKNLARQHISFDEDWKFHLGNAVDPAKDFNFSTTAVFSKAGKADESALAINFNDSSWRKLQLPHDWAVELPFENSPSLDVMSHGYKPVGPFYPQSSIGWYRKHFRITKSDSGQRFEIQFDGIYRDSKIWINGFYLGTNASGYCGVSYDITNYIRFEKENVLVVRVDASQYEGWFYEGAGIYRHVWLNTMNNLHIADNGIFLSTRVDRGSATVNIETSVRNESNASAKATLTSYITDRYGKIVAQSTAQPVSVNGYESKSFNQKIIVSKPVLWSPDNPYLYRAIVQISPGPTGSGIKGDPVIDSEKLRFGIRAIRIDSSGFYINGNYTKIKGINAHQDHAGVGSALPDNLQYYRIRLLKEMGANAYRTSHNPPTPELLDACDSLGMLVLDENRLMNSSPEYMAQFEHLILRDRNRASVFLWCIGNEEGYAQTNSIGRRIAQSLIERQKVLDPTRLCTYGADLDNIYNGVNEVIPVRGFNYRIAAVDPYHADHPGQPILGTEMGSTVTTRGIYIKDSIKGYLPDEDIMAPWWATTAEAWWTLAATRPWWMGGFVWSGFDYRGEPTPYEWPDINSNFGVMDMCGFPKNIYYYYQSWWTDEDVLHISPDWNRQGKENRLIPVWVNTNADSVELFLNGKSLGKKNMPRNRHLEWEVQYETGTLEAIAYKNGRKFNARVETTGEPYEVVVTPYKTTMMADGKDATVINISVVDHQGREVPDASDLIRFSVNGDLKMIGVGNGNPSSHEPDKCGDGAWQRHLFNGKCQVIVQSGYSNSLIKFEASAEGLKSGSTEIYTVLPGAVQIVHPLETKMNLNIPYAGLQKKNNLNTVSKSIGKMLGADISFLPELEARGMKFSDRGVQKDALEILKDHGFNYIRLRIFKDPQKDSGYSPGKGFCDLEHTKSMAKRIRAAGMKFLLDFHYSDYWADPGKQFKPEAWKGKSFQQLQDSVYAYTGTVLLALKNQGTPPDMVQVGNEINHGMLWPEGHVRSFDSLAQLVYVGIQAVHEMTPDAVVMIHIALGGQNDESHFFLDNLISRKVPFDVIGLSYYPKWHGTLADLKYNINNLSDTYRKDIIVVEYSQYKEAVNEIAFTAAGGRGKGTCIWEPLNTWESVFDKAGNSNSYLAIYDSVSNRFIKSQTDGDLKTISKSSR
jgi:beta-galactosidase